MKTAIYPGSFDPFTLGHLDILKSACKIFDHVVVVVCINMDKSNFFLTYSDRIKSIAETIKANNIENAEVVFDGGLTVDIAQGKKAVAIVRSARSNSDFEKELDVAWTNKILSIDNIDTVLIIPNKNLLNIRSSTVRELVKFNCKDVIFMVPDEVWHYIKKQNIKEVKNEK